MTAKERQELEQLVEQKMLEFFGDPDAGLSLDKSFAVKLRKKLDTEEKLTPHAAVLKKYGIR